MIDWVVYYENGLSFSSDDGSAGDAPRDGVQCISVRDDRVGKLIWHSHDFYCWQDDEWVPRSELGLYDYLRQPGTEKIVLQGRGIGYRRFVAIYTNAVDDDRLPVKFAKDLRESEIPT